jgi:hypothetical protein
MGVESITRKPMGPPPVLNIHDDEKFAEYVELTKEAMKTNSPHRGQIVPLEDAKKTVKRIGKPSLIAGCLLHMAVTYYRKRNIEKAVDYMDQFLQTPNHEAIAQRDWSTTLWEICWAIEVGELPHRSGCRQVHDPSGCDIICHSFGDGLFFDHMDFRVY